MATFRPLTEIQPVPCTCGCGQPVKTPGARLLPGHNNYRDGKPRSEWVPCENPGCDRGRWVLPSSKRGKTFCSFECRCAAARHLPTWNLLQKRCLTLMDRERLTLAGFARLVGVDRSVLKSWADFLSNLVRDQPPRRIEVEDPLEWAGISVFDSLAEARARARSFPVLGRYVAEVRVP